VPHAVEHAFHRENAIRGGEIVWHGKRLRRECRTPRKRRSDRGKEFAA
jgi:hypothetical protein